MFAHVENMRVYDAGKAYEWCFVWCVCLWL